MSGARQPQDPFASFRFKVEVNGITQAHFQSVSGLSVTIEAVAQKEGGVNDHVHQLRGPTTYGKIVLKRGVTTDKSFLNWIKSWVAGKGTRQQGTIRLLSEAGDEVQSWSFSKAWPCKWEGGSFETSSSAALIETLELAHEGLSDFVNDDSMNIRGG